MAEQLGARGGVAGAEGAETGPGPLERLASFRVTYLGIFLALLAYVFSVEAIELALERVFAERLAEAVAVDPGGASALDALRVRVDGAVRESAWIDPGGVRVTAIVLGADGYTLLYAGGAAAAPLPLPGLEPAAEDPGSLLPATTALTLSVAHGSLVANGVLVIYFAVLVSGLVAYTRRLTRGERQRIEAVREARDAISERARRIERELGAVREQLDAVGPEREDHAAEVTSLETERTELLARLSALEQREGALRERGGRVGALEQERQALEELLDEAVGDLSRRDEEIVSLQQEVKRAEQRKPAPRGREADQLARRLRTLYKNLEIDDRAISDLVALRDETMKLKAEEALKRLSDEAEQAPVRRKVGGLPAHLSIFELGFGKGGRIYYTRGKTRRHRILSVGAKNTQKPDLEYLSRLPKGT